VCALKPCGRGLLLETLRYADEVNKAGQFFRGIGDAPSPPELLELATALIEKKKAPFDAEHYRDRYAEALRALIDAKLGHRRKAKAANDSEPAVRPTNVVDLMAALKQSIEKAPAAKAKAPAAKAPAKAAPKARPAGRRAAAEPQRKRA